MPEYLAPGVYIEEIPSGVRAIEGAGTSTAAFVGVAERGPINRATLLTKSAQFDSFFGAPIDARQGHYLGHAVKAFFAEGGTRCWVVRVAHYTDLFDPNGVAAETASATFQDANGTAALTVNAASAGAWGRGLEVLLQNTSRFETALAVDRPTGTFDRITVTSTHGIERGTLLWIAAPIIAVVTYSGTTLEWDFLGVGLFRDPEGTPLAAADTIADASTVITPDFRYMANLSGSVTLAAGANPEPTLTNLTVGAAAANHDVLGTALRQGQTLWIVEPARQALAVVDRVEDNEVVFSNSITTTTAFAAGTRVLSRDVTLAVREARGPEFDLVETFPNVSMVASNLRDFAPNRINLGGSASRFIRVAATGTTAPMRNAAFTALTGSSSDPDGLAELGPNDYVGNPTSGSGLSALEDVDEISTLAIPYPRFNDPAVTGSQADLDLAIRQVYNAATAYCERRRYLFCVLDSKPGQDSVAALAFRNSLNASNYAAFYYPWIRPLGQTGRIYVPPSGAIAGIYAFSDQKRGVHKAPAGTSVGRVKSAGGVEREISKAEQDGLNPFGVNVLRSFADSGLNVWGARTISTSAEWRYVNVRRLLNFIEKSIDDGTQWVVFEPNTPELWAKITRNINAFLRTVWRSGALFGANEDQAFRVKCDAETNTSETIELGQVITEIRVVVVKPAEFVIFRIRQMAAGAEITE